MNNNMIYITPKKNTKSMTFRTCDNEDLIINEEFRIPNDKEIKMEIIFLLRNFLASDKITTQQFRSIRGQIGKDMNSVKNFIKRINSFSLTELENFIKNPKKFFTATLIIPPLGTGIIDKSVFGKINF